MISYMVKQLVRITMGNIVIYIIYKLLYVNCSNSEMVKENWKQYLCLVPNKYASPCQGDSGGPLICNNLLYGLCSFMYPYIGNNTECGSPNQQVVYMFVDSHRKWLKNIIESKTKKNKRSSENLLKPRHYTLYIILTILLCNTLTFI